jgi:hypothetical protein
MAVAIITHAITMHAIIIMDATALTTDPATARPVMRQRCRDTDEIEPGESLSNWTG